MTWNIALAALRLPVRVDWCSEGLPGLTQKVLMALVGPDRQTPNAGMRARILEEQGNSCSLCGAAFQEDLELEWDHIAPLHSTCQSAEQVFQALCTDCHKEKTAQRGKQDRTLVSRTSP